MPGHWHKIVLRSDTGTPSIQVAFSVRVQALDLVHGHCARYLEKKVYSNKCLARIALKQRARSPSVNIAVECRSPPRCILKWVQTNQALVEILQGRGGEGGGDSIKVEEEKLLYASHAR